MQKLRADFESEKQKVTDLQKQMREKAEEARALLEAQKNETKEWKNNANSFKAELERLSKSSESTIAKLQAELQ